MEEGDTRTGVTVDCHTTDTKVVIGQENESTKDDPAVPIVVKEYKMSDTDEMVEYPVSLGDTNKPTDTMVENTKVRSYELKVEEESKHEEVIVPNQSISFSTLLRPPSILRSQSAPSLENLATMSSASNVNVPLTIGGSGRSQSRVRFGATCLSSKSVGAKGDEETKRITKLRYQLPDVRHDWDKKVVTSVSNVVGKLIQERVLMLRDVPPPPPTLPSLIPTIRNNSSWFARSCADP